MALTFAEIEQKLVSMSQAESLAAFVADAAQDDRIAEAAQLSLVRLSLVATDRPRIAATVLAAGVRSETIAAIKSDAEIDHTLPEGTGAGLTGPLGGDTAPTVVYRDELSADPDALDEALGSSLNDASTVGENVQPVASISCMVYCGLCAIALADGVPFDEIFFCSVCLTCAADA